MALPALIIPAVIEAGIKVIERIFPDPNEAAKAKVELFKLQQTGELAALAQETEIATGQAKINEVEAASDSLFKSGWRPAVGWICVVGLSYQFFARPTMNFLLAITEHTAMMPALELDTLMTLLFGILGLGWFRSYEKVNGISR